MEPSVLNEFPDTEAVEAGSFAAGRKRFQRLLPPNVPSLILDGEGSIQHLTASARRMLGYRAEQHIDPCFFSHVHGRNLYQIMRDVADMVCYGKGEASWLLRLRSGDGRWLWYKALATNRLAAPEQVITITLRELQDV